MVCLFLLPVIAKITTDCLILIGCGKVSLNLIGCLKKLSSRTKCSTSLDWGSSGLYAGAYKKFVPFFGLTLSPDKVCICLSFFMAYPRTSWRVGTYKSDTAISKRFWHLQFKIMLNIPPDFFLHFALVRVTARKLLPSKGNGKKRMIHPYSLACPRPLLLS